MRTNFKYDKIIEAISGSIVGLGFLGAVIILGYQIFQWLKTGEWLQMPFYVLFSWLDIDLSVIANITWQGVKKILIWILELPLSLMSIVLGGLIAYVFMSTFEPEAKKPE
jgi:hypothetical protein